MTSDTPRPMNGPVANDFLAGGGEMGDRIRGFDWAAHPLGPPAGWPQSLKIVVRILLSSRYAMWLGWGPDLTFFYNDAYARMTLGPKHPWALGRPAREVWSEIWADIGPRAEGVLATGEATWDEGLLLFLERNGYPEETYHTFSYSPVPDDGGGVGGMLCVVTEDTERTIGEQRLKTLRELAARTADEPKSAEDACQTAAHLLGGNPHDVPFALLYLLDGGGRTATLAGRAGAGRDMPATPAVVELTGEDRPWPFRRVAEAGQVVVVHDLTEPFGPLPGGAWPEPAKQAVVLPMAKPGQAQLAGFVVAGVSPRRPLDDGYRGFLDLVAGQVATAVANARAYEEERRRAEELAELDRAKTAFFSNVSHEFRTPLTLLLGPLDDVLAPGNEVLPHNRELLAVARRNGQRLQKLVNSLLDFSRIEAGRVRASYRPTDLAALTAELASNFRSACDKAGLAFEVDCPPLPGPVYADREMWEKVVLNLVSNAFKYTLAGGIRVGLRASGGRAELTVADTGSGIPEHELPNLFNRFHRVEGTKARTHEGTGIGLALVQELVRMHGGTVAVRSTHGRGSEFTVAVPFGRDHLPADRVDADPVLTSTVVGPSPFVEEALRWLPGADGEATVVNDAAALDGVARSDGRVLLADDNTDMRGYIARLLAAQGYAVTAVPNGRRAVEAARRERPDLVLTDVMMPELDGFGLLRELRADPTTADVPVVLLSARAGEEARVEGLAAGADDYLVKPFSARELLARVGGAVALARVRREATAAVRQRDEFLGGILGSITDAFYSLDRDWRFAFVNDEIVRRFGTPREGIVGGHIWELFPAAVGGEAHAQLTRAMAGRVPVEYEVYYPPWDRWFFDKAYPTADGGLAVYSHEITARKRAEAELRASEGRFRETADTAPAMLWVTGPDGACTYLSRGWYEFTGQTEADGLGPGWLDAVHPDDRERAGRQFLAANSAREAFALEHRVRRADGEDRWVIDAGRPRFDRAGGFQGFVGSVLDVTDQRRAAEQLRLVTDNLPALVSFLDADRRYVFVNRAYEEWFGRPTAEVVGRTVREVVGESAYAKVRSQIDRVLGGERVDFEDFLPYRDGGGRHVHVSYVPRREGDRVTGWFALITDLTDRLRAEQALRESQAFLDRVTGVAPTMLYVYDLADTRNVWVNRSVLTALGFTEDEVRGMGADLLPRLLHPEDAGRYEAHYARLRRLGPDEVAEFEYRMKHADGSWRWLVSREMAYARGDDGAVTQVVGAALDVTERKAAEAALKDVQARLEATLAAGEVATWTWDVPADRVTADRNLARLFGVSDADAAGGPIAAYLTSVHPDDRERVGGLIGDAIAARTSYEATYRVRHADGEYRSVVARGRAEYAPNGTPTRLDGVTVDVTRQREAEERLRRSHDSFLNLIESNPFGVYLVDADFRLARVSLGSQKVFANVRPLLGRDFAEVLRLIWPEPAAGEFIGRFRHTLATGEPYVSVDTTARRADVDAVESYDWRIERVPLPDGRHGVVCYFYDMTERRKVEDALTEARERLALALTAGQAGTFTWSIPDGRVDWSPELEDLYGVPRGTFAGTYAAWSERLVPEDVAAVEETVRRCLDARAEDCEYEFRAVLPDGRQRWLAGRAKFAFAPDGAPLRMAGINFDVEARKRAEEALKEADRRKDEFLATLAHELRNPLAPVRTGLQIMKLAPADTNGVAKARDMMERQLGHMVRLIDDLLDISRVSRGKVELKRERVDLRAVVETAVETSRPLVDAGRHELTVSLPEGPVWVDADHTRLAQVVSNVLTNAAKYTPDGGRITLTARRDGATAEVAVTDTGLGIPADMLAGVFDMFAQVNRTLDRAQGGLGIGLALVRKLMGMHGGTITAASPGPGRGSTFTVRLPAAAAPGPVADRAERNGRAAVGRRVLVVDDNRDGAESLAMLLELSGHIARVAHDGPAALDEARLFDPDVVFLDIGMPGMNGYEVAKRFRGDDRLRGAVLVALTGWGSEDDKQRSRDAGFDSHLTKPVESAAVEAVLAGFAPRGYNGQSAGGRR